MLSATGPSTAAWLMQSRITRKSSNLWWDEQMNHRRTLIALSIAAALPLAGCGDGGSEESTSREPSSTEVTHRTTAEESPEPEVTKEPEEEVSDTPLSLDDLPARGDQSLEQRRAAEDNYILLMRATVEADIDHLSDETLIETATVYCDYVDENPGVTHRLSYSFATVMEAPEEIGDDEALPLYIGAMMLVCPEHESSLREEMQDWD